MIGWLYIKYERTGNGGERQAGPCQRTPTLVLPAYSKVLPLVILELHRAQVEDARRTPTSRIRLRPSVLDRQPVPLRAVEPSNRSCERVSSPIPLYYRYLEPVLDTVGGPCLHLPADRRLRKNCAYTPLRWGRLCYSGFTVVFFGKDR